MNYVLVTGCNGFIGSRLTKLLLEKGYNILGISRNKYSRISHKNFKYVQLDLTDSLALEELFYNHEISSVVHLAAIAHLKGREQIDWNEFYRINVLVSKTVFECAIKANAKIFYASSVDVYGQVKSTLIREDCVPIPVPVSDYAKSKYFAENVLKEKAANSNTNYCIGRFAPVYGTGYMKDVYKRIYLKYPNLAFLIGSGNNYHFVSVNNVLDFIVYWVGANSGVSGTFNIGDEEPINAKTFIKLEKSIGNAKNVVYLSNKLLFPLKIILELTYKLTKNHKLNKIRKNLYKLISPPKYSTKKLNTVVSMRWNLRNTVYDNIE